MKSVSLFKQMLAGLLISLFASISIYSLSLVFNYTDSLNLSIAATSIIYIAFVLNNSHLKTGRLLVFSLLSLGALVMCFLVSPSQLIIGASLLSIFVVRVIFYQANWLPAIFDAGLIALGLFIASGVLVSTNSWFLCFWCFFFIQSFTVYQADIFSARKKESCAQEKATNQKFYQAKKLAEQAIQQVASQLQSTH